MAERILAEARTTWSTPPDRGHTRLWLTTIDVARALDVSTGFVRRLARRGDLPSEVTESHQHLFRWRDVWRVLIARGEARARGRASVLRAVRVRMLKAGFEPRQASLFGPRLQLVQSAGERVVPHAEPKRARSGEIHGGSEKPRYVNRRSAGGRR